MYNIGYKPTVFNLLPGNRQTTKLLSSIAVTCSFFEFFSMHLIDRCLVMRCLRTVATFHQTRYRLFCQYSEYFGKCNPPALSKISERNDLSQRCSMRYATSLEKETFKESTQLRTVTLLYENATSVEHATNRNILILHVCVVSDLSHLTSRKLFLFIPDVSYLREANFSCENFS